MSQTTNAITFDDYAAQIFDHLGVDPEDVDRSALESVSLAELKMFAQALGRDEPLERDGMANAEDFPSPIAPERAAQNEAAEDDDGDEFRGALSPRKRRLISQAQDEEGPTQEADGLDDEDEDTELSVTEAELEEQTDRLTDALREGGREAVAAVEDVDPTVREAFLDEVDAVMGNRLAEQIAANTDRDLDDLTGLGVDALEVLAEELPEQRGRANYAAQTGARASSSSDSDEYPSPIAGERTKQLDGEGS